ncbi:MAG: NTP transferase domain-containing protein [Actinomycetota bacterium]
MTEPTLLILAAGNARRYGDIKPLAPIGPNGEGVIDLLANDALSAGFTRLVVVINPNSGPNIRAHIAEHWATDRIDVDFALQEEPHGTVHAVLCAHEAIGDSAFAVSNADDLYGPAALTHLHRHLSTSPATNAMVAFQLGLTLVGTGPVTRGVCKIEADHLISIDERRGVHRTDTGSIIVDDAGEACELSPSTQVSMNLWSFGPEMWELFRQAMELREADQPEVLLPVVVNHLLNGTWADIPEPLRSVSAYTSNEHCVGVTHPGDLELVKAHIAHQIHQGARVGALSGSLYH